jgi:dienelactone hydrolase
VVAGWSHGAQTVLSVLDASDKAVRAQPLKPAAAVAFYPGCSKFQRMFSYELSAPLLIMIGELDDWTPAASCVALAGRLSRPGQPAAQITVYPGSYHGFDGTAPVEVRGNLGNTRSGKATVGGNPQAREQSHARLFDFLSAQLGQPLVLAHEQRLQVRPEPAAPAAPKRQPAAAAP